MSGSATTSVNPGAMNPSPPVTLKFLIVGALGRLRRRQIRASRNFLVAHAANYLAQRRKAQGFYCNLCKNDLTHFVALANELRISWNSACPRCNSRKRHRGLLGLYQDLLGGFPEIPKVLHLAPEPIFYDFLRSARCDYKTTDFFLEDVDFPHEDIQSLTFANDSFDMVLCNHVIEHVEDDRAAFAELERILTPGGVAVITIPGEWARPKTIDFPDLSFNGHYRDYGLDVVEKLERAFDEVESIDLYDFAGGEAPRLGLVKRDDLAFVCRKR